VLPSLLGIHKGAYTGTHTQAYAHAPLCLQHLLVLVCQCIRA